MQAYPPTVRPPAEAIGRSPHRRWDRARHLRRCPGRASIRNLALPRVASGRARNRHVRAEQAARDRVDRGAGRDPRRGLRPDARNDRRDQRRGCRTDDPDHGDRPSVVVGIPLRRRGDGQRAAHPIDRRSSRAPLRRCHPSWWVPEIAGKIDMVPGQKERSHSATRSASRRAVRGVLRIEHAWMRLRVIVEKREDFDRWLAPSADRRAHRAAPASRVHGQHLRELPLDPRTAASGTAGPDLTHVAGRGTSAPASCMTSEHARLARGSAALQPGALMPRVPFGPDLDALAPICEPSMIALPLWSEGGREVPSAGCAPSITRRSASLHRDGLRVLRLGGIESLLIRRSSPPGRASGARRKPALHRSRSDDDPARRRSAAHRFANYIVP